MHFTIQLVLKIHRLVTSIHIDTHANSSAVGSLNAANIFRLNFGSVVAQRIGLIGNSHIDHQASAIDLPRDVGPNMNALMYGLVSTTGITEITPYEASQFVIKIEMQQVPGEPKKTLLFTREGFNNYVSSLLSDLMSRMVINDPYEEESYIDDSDSYDADESDTSSDSWNMPMSPTTLDANLFALYNKN